MRVQALAVSLRQEIVLLFRGRKKLVVVVRRRVLRRTVVRGPLIVFFSRIDWRRHHRGSYRRKIKPTGRVNYRRMGNMEQHLVNATSTTLFHRPRDLWKSPRGTVLHIQALAPLGTEEALTATVPAANQQAKGRNLVEGPIVRRSARNKTTADEHTLKKTARMAEKKNLESTGYFQGDVLVTFLGAAAA